MKILNLLIFAIILSVNCAYSQLLPKFHEEEVEITSNKLTISATLMIPNNAKNPDVVLIIAGSGPTDRNGNNPMAGENNSLKMLAESIANNGIASIRYDKRGIGKSIDEKLDEYSLRFETYINDAKEIIKYLRSEDRFGKISVAGHSEGSLIGMIVAKDMKLDKYISIAGMGRPFDEILREQIAGQPEFIVKKSNEILDSLKNGVIFNNPPTYLNALFRESVQPYLISMFAYNPTKIIKDLKCPILILQGKNDLQVKEIDSKNLKEANQKAEYVLIDKMNHILKDCADDKESNIATYSNPTLPLNTNLVKSLIDFLKEKQVINPSR